MKNAGAIKLRNALTLNTLKSQLTQGKIANWLADRKAARLAKTEDYADQVDNDNYKSKVTYEDCFGDSGEMARELGVGPSTLDNAALCRKAYLDFDQKLGEAQNKMLLAGFAAALK